MDKSRNQKPGIKKQNGAVLFCGVISLFFIFFVSGCVPQRSNCPLLADAIDGQRTLSNYYAGVRPFRAVGTCEVDYLNEQGKRIKQSFPVRIWYVNSEKYCLYGDLIFNPQAVCLAVTDGLYWVYIQPLDFYVNGALDGKTLRYNDIFINPGLLVDFVRPVGGKTSGAIPAATAFSNNTLVYARGEQTKRIYIDRCEKVVKKIEYFDCDLLAKNSKCRNRKAVLVTIADKYEKLKDGQFIFPRDLKYEYYDKKNGRSRMEIKIDSVKLWHPEERQMKALFTPPLKKEFKKEAKYE